MRLLPSEYQEVEYVESSGTQYIDTGVYGTGSTKIDATFVVTNIRSNYDMYYGAYGPTYGKYCMLLQHNYPDNNKIRALNYSNAGSEKKYVDSINNLEFGKKYNVVHTNTGLIINGTTQGTMSATTFTTNYTMYIFGVHTQNGVSSSSLMKLYSFKMYDGTTLQRDFVPCYRKNDSVIGLYDLVNDVFYTNSGTGTFVKGPDINGAKIQRIYVGTDLVRPEWKYSYDFRNKTLAGIQADGWTYGGSNTPTINSGGISIAPGGNDSWSKLYCSPSGLTTALNTANKITLEMFSYIGTVSSSALSNGIVYLSGPSSYTTNGTGLGGGVGETLFDRVLRILGTDLYRGTYPMPTPGEYTQTATIDLKNKTMRYVVSNVLDVTRTITDAQITTIRTLKYIRVGAENNRVMRTMRVTIG